MPPSAAGHAPSRRLSWRCFRPSASRCTGFPFFYDVLVQDLGWTRQQVTSGNAPGKAVIG
jgi:hypothetical protein